jgi:hypothetical protein
MSTLPVKVGVALGMVATVVSFFPIFKLSMGECFFEQGCGRHENVQVIGVALALPSWGPRGLGCSSLGQNDGPP